MSRPTKLNDITVKKLEDAFILGGTIEEACFNANISKQTYYNWKDKNVELFDRLELLKQSPVLKARKSLINSFDKHPNLAMKYLEHCKGSLLKTETNNNPNQVIVTFVD